MVRYSPCDSSGWKWGRQDPRTPRPTRGPAAGMPFRRPEDAFAVNPRVGGRVMLLRSLGQMAGAREITTLGNNKATIVGGRLGGGGRPTSEREAAYGDRGQEQQDHHGRGEHGGPARITERGWRRIRTRRPAGARDGDLAGLTDRPRSGARIGGGRSPGGPGACRGRGDGLNRRAGGTPVAAGRRSRRRKCAVVLGSAHRVGEDDPRLVDAPHPIGGLVGALVQIWMVLLRQPSMRARHLERCRLARDTEHRVGIERLTAVHGADSTAAGRPPSV